MIPEPEDPRVQKLGTMLAALDRSLRDLKARAAAAREGISFHSLAPYYAYRAGLDEYRALVAVIENDLTAVGSKRAPPFREKLHVIERRMLGLTIKSALDFFFALSAIPNLPVGIRECFMQELSSLHEASERLNRPVHEGKLPADLAGDLAIAEEILGEIMLKAPSLVNFDAA